MSPKTQRRFFKSFGTLISIALGFVVCALLGGVEWFAAFVGRCVDVVASSAKLPAAVVTIYCLCAAIIIVSRKVITKWEERQPRTLDCLCEECGYDLIGVPQKPVLRCPECGTARTLDDNPQG